MVEPVISTASPKMPATACRKVSLSSSVACTVVAIVAVCSSLISRGVGV